MGKAVIRKSLRIYDLLLKCYPKNYRQEFGEEMKFVFSESLKDTYRDHGELGIFLLWLRTSVDAGKSLVTQHIESQKGGDSMKTTTTISQRNISKRLGIWALVVAGILMIPFVAKFPWTGRDFTFAGIVLFVCAAVYEFTTKNMKNKIYRAAVAIAILAFIVLVIAWAATGPDGMN
jgi:hypothetical protein